MTVATPIESGHFAYQAQTDDGLRLSGTIDAPNVESATSRLQALRLRITEIQPTAPPARPRRVGGDDFLAFNQQLAQLTRAGMPVERGLRLIAADLRRGRLARTVSLIAAELENGTPLGEAFEKHKGRFPTLYGRLVEAGVRGGNLSGILLSLGRHLETEQRLRGALWRALSYPTMVLVGLMAVIAFLGGVIQQFQTLYKDWGIKIPASTRVLLELSKVMPAIGISCIVLVLLVPLVFIVLRAMGKDRAAADIFLLPLPLIGPVLRSSMIARWLEAAKIGVEAGLDLPAALELAGDATGSPAMSRDGMQLIESLRSGQPLTAVNTRLLPATVPAAIEFASGHNDLPSTLGTMVDLYQRQSDTRSEAIPAVLTPILVILIALIVGFVITALFMPMVTLIQAISGPS